MLSSPVALRHVSSVPAVVQGSVVLVIAWHDGRTRHAMHLHCDETDATPERIAALETLARGWHRAPAAESPRLTLI